MPKEEKKDDKKKEPKKHSRGEMSFGTEILIFIIILFIIWAVSSKPSENVDKPFIKEKTVNILPQ